MKQSKLSLIALLALCSATALAHPPAALTVINNIDKPTDVQVHGMFTGNVAAPNSIASFPWPGVVTACNGVSAFSMVNVCAVEVFVSPNSGDQVDIGGIFINLETGGTYVAHQNCGTGYELHGNQRGQVMVDYTPQ